MKIDGTVIISVISAEALRFMNHIIRRVNIYRVIELYAFKEVFCVDITNG